MITANTDTSTHNPNRVEHLPPAATREPGRTKPQWRPSPPMRLRHRVKPQVPAHEQLTAQEAFILSEIETIRAEISAVSQRLSANICMWFVWLIGWILNGAATVIAVSAVGLSLGALLVRRDWIDVAPTPANWILIGVCLHLLISRVEQYLWKPDTTTAPPSWRKNFRAWLKNLRPRVEALWTVRTLQAVVIGSLDSLSSARAGLVLVGSTTALSLVVCGMLGTGLAMSAEPMMSYHWRQLRPQWRQLCFLRSRLSSLQSALGAASL